MNIIDKYGIKEVAEVTLYELDDFGNLKNPILFLDTLQVSTIKYTADETQYLGGPGLQPLMSWEHSENIEIQISDALFSIKSMAYLCGGQITENNNELILKTENFKATDIKLPKEKQNESGWNSTFTALDGKQYIKRQPRFYNSNQQEVKSLNIGETYYCTYYLNSKNISIDITEDNFPEYCCIIGETFVRSELTNEDEFFYFVIPKAKLVTTFTIELGAELHTVFDLKFKAVKSKNLNLMELLSFRSIENEIIEEDDIAVLGRAILGKLILNKEGNIYGK